jgi:RNA polymerase sigma factor (sigma-70 family)
MTRTDAELIAESLSDGVAFGAVFDRHFVTIHRYLARRVGADADDLASEVFTIAFARRHDYRLDRDSALPWLYGIASNLVLGQRRSAGRRLGLVERLPRATTGEERFETRVDDAVDASSEAARLQERVDRLSPDDRTTLLLYAWEDLTYAEVAVALDVPVGTVRSRLNRVRRQLREPPGPGGTRTGRQPTRLPEGKR